MLDQVSESERVNAQICFHMIYELQTATSQQHLRFTAQLASDLWNLKHVHKQTSIQS